MWRWLGIAARTGAVAVALVAGGAGPARADELTPELETRDLQQKASAELRALVGKLSGNDQRRLAGVYLAFDPSSADPAAVVACDDDGDYVIVVTEAMLRLVSLVARAQSYDETSGGRSTEDYAAFLARAQLPGRRLLPPPPGFYAAQKAAPTHDAHLREALGFVVSRELAHLRSGDLVCPHPTATHEQGDDEWTPTEQRKAAEGAPAVYGVGNAANRDSEATSRLLETGRSESGGLGLLRFFGQLEVERTVHASRFLPSYLLHHPSSATRASTVRAAATAARGARQRD